MAEMIPPRLADWRPRLSRYLTVIMARPFSYGTHDCALFVAGAVEAMTGKDVAAPYRGRYASVVEGLDLLRPSDWGIVDQPAAGEAGFDHLSVLDQLFDRAPLAFAQLGDIAAISVPGANLPALGIFEGQHIAVLREASLGFAPREAAIAAWRVP